MYTSMLSGNLTATSSPSTISIDLITNLASPLATSNLTHSSSLSSSSSLFSGHHQSHNPINKMPKTWRDIIEPSLIGYIPDFWLNFEPPKKYEHYILGVTYLLILIPAIFGNGAIIWLFYRCRNLRTPSNILVVNLALADLIQNLKMPIFIYNSFKCGPAMGELGCQIYGFFGGLSGTSAIMTIAMMAMERLNSISRPLSPNSRLSMRRALVISTLIWIYSLIFSTPPVFHLFNRYVPEGYLTSCSFDYLSKDLVSRAYIFAFFTAAWIVPLTLIVTSYAGIIIAVERNETMFQKTQDKLCERASSVYRASLRDSRGRSIKESGKMEMRLVKIVLSLIALWILAWTPYAIIALLGLLDQSYITPTSSMIPALFAKLSSVINPYLYGLGNPRFKRELKRKLCFCLSNKNNGVERRAVIQSTATLGDHKPESHFINISDGNLSEIELSDYEKR